MSAIDEATGREGRIEEYYEAGWADGLPVVPPSDASIAAMLAAAGLDGHEELGAIPGRNAIVIADKAATNAVMAGCRPEYMPVVVAAVKSLCAPAFAYHGPASSTGGAAPAMVRNPPRRCPPPVTSGQHPVPPGPPPHPPPPPRAPPITTTPST